MRLGTSEWGYIAGILFDSERYRDLVRLSRTSKLVHQGCSKEMEKMSLVCTRCRETMSRSCAHVRYYTRGENPVLFSPIGYALPGGDEHPIRFDCSSWRRRGLLPAEILVMELMRVPGVPRIAYARWVSNGETYCVERHRVKRPLRKGGISVDHNEDSCSHILEMTSFPCSQPDVLVLKLWLKHGLLHRDGDLPAVTTGDWNRLWFRDGSSSRDDGRPVVVYREPRELTDYIDLPAQGPAFILRPHGLHGGAPKALLDIIEGPLRKTNRMLCTEQGRDPSSHLVGVFVPTHCHLEVDLPTVLFEDDLPPSILRRLEREYTHPVLHDWMHATDMLPWISRNGGMSGSFFDPPESPPTDEQMNVLESNCTERMERLEEVVRKMQGREFPVYETISTVKGTLLTTRIEYDCYDYGIERISRRCQIPWPLPD